VDTKGGQNPAIIRLWKAAWAEFIPFLDDDVEIRRIICSTNAIESLNARYRRAVRARGHFPTEQAALTTNPGTASHQRPGAISCGSRQSRFSARPRAESSRPWSRSRPTG
jgi:transposase-like protein